MPRPPLTLKIPFGLRGRGQGRAGPERPVSDAGLPQRPDAVRAKSLWHKAPRLARGCTPQTEERVLRGLDQPDARPRRRQRLLPTRAARWSWRRGSRLLCHRLLIHADRPGSRFPPTWRGTGKTRRSSAKDPRHTVSTAPASHRENAQYPHELGGRSLRHAGGRRTGAVSAPQGGYIVRRLRPVNAAGCRASRMAGANSWATLRHPKRKFGAGRRYSKDTGRRRGRQRNGKRKRNSSNGSKTPGSDTAQYKAYGNSVCVNVVLMLMFGIKWAADQGFS